MQLSGIEGIVFDLDGTLVHSTTDYTKMVAGVQEILKSHSIEVDPAQRRIWEIVQRSDMHLQQMGIEASVRHEINDKITEVLNSVELENVDKVTPIAGASETLEALKQKGLKIGVATRSCNAFTTEALRRTGLTPFVDVLVARDDTPYPKPDPRHLLRVIDELGISREKAIFVGDTTTDLRTAKDADVAFVGFSIRPEWSQRLRQEGCEPLDSLTKLVDLLERPA